VTGVGVALALVAAIAYNAGLVLEKRALAALPTMDIRRPYLLLRTLITAPAWLVGFWCMVIGLGCQVLALQRLPISVAQPLQVSGLGVLVSLSWLVLGERVSGRDRWRLTAALLSVPLLGLSLGGQTGAGTTPVDPLWLSVVLGGSAIAAGLASANAFGSRRHRHRLNTGMPAGLATGLLYGMAGLALKALSSQLVHRGVWVALFASPYPYLVGVASAAGMVLFQIALQRHRASVVVPTSNLVGSCYVLVAGTWLFHENLPADPTSLGLRLAGFAVTVVALAIRPERVLAPRRDVASLHRPHRRAHHGTSPAPAGHPRLPGRQGPAAVLRERRVALQPPASSAAPDRG
jgi:drug/metabolite transporter (DMT)-like permease